MALTLRAFNYAANGVSGQIVDYTPYLTDLRVSSVAPGGFASLIAQIRQPPGRARLPRPELTVMNGRVILTDGAYIAFAGEVSELVMTLDDTGDGINLKALGASDVLTDDPADTTYAIQTGNQILGDQYAQRSAWIALDGDFSAVLPANPAATFSPAYDGKTFEDILHDVCDLLGDYVWAVWDHPVHRDSLGLPTWRLEVHPRNTSTLGYIATIADVQSWSVGASSVRAFNGVTVRYLDPANGPGAIMVQDSRLNANKTQGAAPFRFRRFRRDMGGRPLNSTQATALANQYLASFQNVANVITLTLTGVRDAQGHPIPLWRVRADKNMLIPELLPRGFTLPVPPAAASGTNLFYIRQATYEQRPGRTPTLTVQLDQVADFAAADLTRMQYDIKLRERAKRNPPNVQPPGVSVKGHWSMRWGAAGLAGDVWGASVTFPTVLTQAPSSLTFTQIAASNSSAPTATNLTNWGAQISVTAAGNGGGYWIGTYSSNGN